MDKPRAWMPPFWLIALDVVGSVLLCLGLFVHYSPQAPIAAGFLGAVKFPLIVVGLLMMGAGALLILKTVLQHSRSSR